MKTRRSSTERGALLRVLMYSSGAMLRAPLLLLALTLSLSHFLTCTHAATLTGTIASPTGTPYTATVQFIPIGNPQIEGGTLITRRTITLTATNGVFSVNLEQGNYRVIADGQNAFLISVPNDGSTYNFQHLAVNNLTYVYPVPPANSSLFGNLQDVLDWNTATNGQVPVYNAGLQKLKPGTLDGSVLPAGVTFDTEWDTTTEINAATTDDDFVTLAGAQTITAVKNVATNFNVTAGTLGANGFQATNPAIFFGASNTMTRLNLNRLSLAQTTSNKWFITATNTSNLYFSSLSNDELTTKDWLIVLKTNNGVARTLASFDADLEIFGNLQVQSNVVLTSLTASRPVLSDSGKNLVSGPIDLGNANHLTGNLPVTNLNSGTGASSATFWRGDGTWGTAAGATPGFVVDSDELIQANVSALGPAGTNAFCYVGGSANYETNGFNLLTAYAAAKLKTPHGFAKSATNRYSIFLLPGKYRLVGGALVLDTQFIDLIGLSPNTGSRVYDFGALGQEFGDTIIESDGDTVTVTVNPTDYTLANLALITSNGSTPALQTTVASRLKEKLINVLLFNTSDILNASMADDVHFDGTYVDVRAWNAGSFGYRVSGPDISASGWFERCKAGPFAFGVSLVDTHGTANGTFIDCEADGVSFGRLIANGKFLRCRFVNITGTAGVMYAANTTRSGTFIDCSDESITFTHGTHFLNPLLRNVVTVAGRFDLSNSIAPAQITADQNDYNPSGLTNAATLLLSSDASRSINGIIGSSGFGRVLLIVNIGAQNLVLADDAAGSATTNRFELNAAMTLLPQQGTIVIYSGTNAAGMRWRALSAAGAGGSGSGETNTASNLGTGWPTFDSKSGVDLRFNTWTNDASLASASNANTFTMSRAALTGDVTASAGANATTIANNAVTDAKLRDSAANSVIGRASNSAGDPADIGTSTAGQVLRLAGTTLGFGALDLADADAVANVLPRANIPSQLAYEDEDNTFSSDQTFNANLLVNEQVVYAELDMGGGTAIDVTEARQRKSVSGTTTLTFSGSPLNQQNVTLIITNTVTSAQTTVNIPSSHRPNVGEVTSFSMKPASVAIVVWTYSNSKWYVEIDGDQILENLSATTNPTVSDDAADGYNIGSRWINTTADTEWICTDATAGVALWKNTTGDEFGYKQLTYAGGTNITLNLATSREFYLTLTNTAFVATPSNIPTNGATFFVKFKQDATGARAVTWTNATFKFPGGTVPTITTNANAVDTITCTLSPFTQGQVYAVQTADFK